jgi:O-antigen ligase
MTFSGLQMLSILAVMSLLLSGRAGRYWWVYPAIPIQIFGLVLAQTRSAWLGLLVGLLALALMINWRWVLVVTSFAAASYLVLPRGFQDRLGAAFDLSDSTTRIRLELLRTGWNIIKAHPFFGVGPEMVARDYVKYKTVSEFPNWIYQHLHNDFVQIAAEMGLLALLAWMALLLSFLTHCVRHLVGAHLPEEKKFAARAAISCLVAFLVAGLFEYNFGDSEVRTLFLFILTSPYVIFREAASSAQQ